MYPPIGRVVAQSGPNRSAASRVGFVTRYATPAMPDPGFPVVLTRGGIGQHRPLALAPRPVETATTLAAYLRAIA